MHDTHGSYFRLVPEHYGIGSFRQSWTASNYDPSQITS